MTDMEIYDAVVRGEMTPEEGARLMCPQESWGRVVRDSLLAALAGAVLALLTLGGCATPGVSTNLAAGPVRPPPEDFARAVACSPAAPCTVTDGVWMPTSVGAYLLGTEAAWQDCRAKCSKCPSSSGLGGYAVTCAACAAAGAGTAAAVSK